MAIIAMTTSSSINVKPFDPWREAEAPRSRAFCRALGLILLDTSCPRKHVRPGIPAGNGLASYWLFSRQANDIYSIRISYVGLTQKGIGLAFDNFWTDSIRPNTDVSSTPEPGSLALLGTGVVGMLIPAWRKRRQKAASEKTA